MADRDPNGERWTLDTIRVLIESNDLRYSQRFQAQSEALSAAFSAQQNAVNAALSAADRAVSKAELASEKRFESVNEFRQSLNDQSRLLMPRAEAEERLRSLKELIDRVSDHIRDLDGRRLGSKDTLAIIISIFGLLASLSSVIFVMSKLPH